MEARLIECGLRWPDEDDEDPEWRAIIAVLETEPPWGPLSRAREPKNWQWYLPGFDQLVTLMETSVVANLQRAGAKKQDFPKRIPRPWDQKTRKLKADEKPIEEFEKWFAQRFARNRKE